MTDSKDRIREMLRGKLESSQSSMRNPRYFASDLELDLATELVLKRYEQISKLSTKLGGSTNDAISYIRERAARGKIVDFPQNSVPFSSLVSQSASIGLCPLPNRVDCLSALLTRYPEIQPESNLSHSEVFSEPISVTRNEPPNNVEDICRIKRLKIKYH
jgi:hypothetical protein